MYIERDIYVHRAGDAWLPLGLQLGSLSPGTSLGYLTQL